jgi:hypothetical protein
MPAAQFSRFVQREIVNHLNQIGIFGVDFDQPGWLHAFNAAAQTRVAAVRAAEAKRNEQQRERDRNDDGEVDPIEQAYGGDGATDEDDLSRYFPKRKSHDEESDDIDSEEEATDDPQRSPMGRYFEQKDSREAAKSPIERYFQPKRKPR